MQKPCCICLGLNGLHLHWFKCLHRAVGSLLRREECLKVSCYGNKALSPLTCFLLHLSHIPIYFLISEPEVKGWRFAFHFRGTLSTAHEILPACLPPFHWINRFLCSHALHSLLRNIRHGTWGTLLALIRPWFLISSWIWKFCTFTSHSREVTIDRLSNSPWESAAFVDSPYQKKKSTQEIIILSFFHHHQPVPDLPPPSLVTLMCSYFKGTQPPCHVWLAVLVHFHQQCCLKPGGILGGTGGVCGGPSGSPGCLGQKVFQQSCSLPSLCDEFKAG